MANSAGRVPKSGKKQRLNDLREGFDNHVTKKRHEFQIVQFRDGVSTNSIGEARRNCDLIGKAGMESGIGPDARLGLERLPAVRARTGMSRSEIYRQISAGSFPAPVKLGLSSSAWVAAEVDRWIAQRIAVRDAGAKA